MKYDLRNRPHLGEFGHYTEFLEAMEEWFVEFEKELREMKQRSDSTTKVYLHWFVEEVLGEET